MNFTHLMNTLTENGRNGFTLKGEYGHMQVKPDGHHHELTFEPTYWVEAEHVEPSTGERVHQRQGGFRFSTVGCLCACVCFGEAAVNSDMVRQVNLKF